MRLLVCGSRDWTDVTTLERVLDDILDDTRTHWHEDPVIVHGACPLGGADMLADAWAKSRGLDVDPLPPQGRGRDALLARNRAMVESGIEGCVAFSTRWPATPGTAYTCRLAYRDGVVVVFVGSDGRQREFYDEHHTTL